MTTDDNILIKNLWYCKTDKRLIKEFFQNNLKKRRTSDHFLRKLRTPALTERILQSSHVVAARCRSNCVTCNVMQL